MAETQRHINNVKHLYPFGLQLEGNERDMALYQRHSALQPAGGNAEESKFAGMTVKDIAYTEK